jgi:hypothetical protein
MKHAGEAALDTIEELLSLIRRHELLMERKRGSFYRKSVGFAHFHEDLAGMFADLKIAGQWKRFRVTTRLEQRRFLSELASELRER